MVLSGASGSKAARINGCYDPTQEKGPDGRVLYTKRGDPSMCIEHCAGAWQVKLVSKKGKDACYASVQGGRGGLEHCSSRPWRSSCDGELGTAASGFKVVLEVEVTTPSCCDNVVQVKSVVDFPDS